MIYRLAYYFSALPIILMHNAIFPAKGQPAVQRFENVDKWNRPEAELHFEDSHSLKEQIQRVHDLLIESVQHMNNLNASFQQMNIQQDTQHKAIMKEIQNWWSFALGKVKLFQTSSNRTKQNLTTYLLIYLFISYYYYIHCHSYCYFLHQSYREFSRCLETVGKVYTNTGNMLSIFVSMMVTLI